MRDRFCPCVPIPAAVEAIPALARLPRHRHAGAYVAVVVDGGYEESGDAGRFTLAPGDALTHRAYEAHRDTIGRCGTKVLNLPICAGIGPQAHWRVPDPDALVAAAARDLSEAAALFLEAAVPAPDGDRDLPDLLARELGSLSALRLDRWAAAHRLRPETATRLFVKAYGVTPHRYRAEARARRAIEEIRTTMRPLSHIAADLGFSDQPHMTRAVKALSGRSPGRWRQDRRLRR